VTGAGDAAAAGAAATFFFARVASGWATRRPRAGLVVDGVAVFLMNAPCSVGHRLRRPIRRRGPDISIAALQHKRNAPRAEAESTR
jgi:hypothetical protein